MKIVRIEDALIHEEIVPELLEGLVKDVRGNQAVKDPVVIDERSRVVLDGMHRVAALRELKLSRLPVCEVDYRKSSVRVGCWYRVVEEGNKTKFLEILQLLGLAGEKCSTIQAKRELARRNAIAAFMMPSQCILVRGSGRDILEIYTWIKRIELALREEGFRIRYEHEEDAEKALGRSAVLMTPCVSKKEVVGIARAGHVFAHKTTRHIIPARPLNVWVPLGWLNERISLAKVNRMFEQSLHEKRIEHLPAGSVWEGRRYEEEVLVFR